MATKQHPYIKDGPARTASKYMRNAEAVRCNRVGRVECHKVLVRRLASKSIRHTANAFVIPKKKALALSDVFFSIQYQSEPLEAEFHALAERWRKDTGKLSMLHKVVMHPAYQQIIGKGEQVLPFIFHEMKIRGGHWIWALQAITGRSDIAKPEHNFRQAFDAWMKWGEKNGYV